MTVLINYCITNNWFYSFMFPPKNVLLLLLDRIFQTRKIFMSSRMVEFVAKGFVTSFLKIFLEKLYNLVRFRAYFAKSVNLL